MTVLFYGDPHGTWQPLLDACAEHHPDAVVLLGDMELNAPLDDVLAPVLDAGIAVRWIAGNHDGDSVHAHDRLFHAGRGLDRCDLHARVDAVAGIRIAGLGGVFRVNVWEPGERVVRTRDDLARSRWSWRGGVPLKHRVSIFAEDVDALRAAGPADILVTHEAPSTHRKGSQELDRLARDLGARLVVHGHHHESYTATTPNGIRVRGLAAGEPWAMPVADRRD